MNRYVKLLAGNAAFAAAAVCLYSPGLMGLSPFSPSAAAAAASIAVGAAAVPAFVWMNRRLLAKEDVELLGKGEEKAGERARERLEGYQSSKVLGGIAKSALLQMERLENAKINFEKLAARRFGAGTLSYQKFMGAFLGARQALSDGYVRMANQMIIFDEAEYQRLSSDEYLKDAIPDDVQEEKRGLYEKNLDTLRAILEKNEKVLLGMERLMMETSNVDDSEHNISHAAEEIDVLLRQLEYYKR